MAFTNYETEQLHKALLKETRRCAVTLGMDELLERIASLESELESERGSVFSPSFRSPAPIGRSAYRLSVCPGYHR